MDQSMVMDVNFDKLPEELRGGMERYIRHGVIPGHFLTAILENDLFDAVGHADAINGQRLPEIVRWVYNEAPSGCWGSPEKVTAWHERMSKVTVIP
jgi:hypothetical protein